LFRSAASSLSVVSHDGDQAEGFLDPSAGDATRAPCECFIKDAKKDAKAQRGLFLLAALRELRAFA